MESAAGHLSPAASTPLCINLTHVAHSLHWFSRVRQHCKDKDKSKDKDAFCAINSQVQLKITLPWLCWRARASHKTSANTRWKVIWLIPIKNNQKSMKVFCFRAGLTRPTCQDFSSEAKELPGRCFCLRRGELLQSYRALPVQSFFSRRRYFYTNISGKFERKQYFEKRESNKHRITFSTHHLIVVNLWNRSDHCIYDNVRRPVPVRL